MRTLSSIPNERGFKMAFLNIVSLPKKIDEINFSMSKKFIDLIAFNETRLDANITDNMILMVMILSEKIDQGVVVEFVFTCV